MAFLNETGLARLWEHILDKFDGIESAAAIPEDTINSIIGEVTTSAEAISV